MPVVADRKEELPGKRHGAHHSRVPESLRVGAQGWGMGVDSTDGGSQKGAAPSCTVEDDQALYCPYTLILTDSPPGQKRHDARP